MRSAGHALDKTCQSLAGKGENSKRVNLSESKPAGLGIPTPRPYMCVPAGLYLSVWASKLRADGPQRSARTVFRPLRFELPWV